MGPWRDKLPPLSFLRPLQRRGDQRVSGEEEEERLVGSDKPRSVVLLIPLPCRFLPPCALSSGGPGDASAERVCSPAGSVCRSLAPPPGVGGVCAWVAGGWNPSARDSCSRLYRVLSGPAFHLFLTRSSDWSLRGTPGEEQDEFQILPFTKQQQQGSRVASSQGRGRK